MKILQSTLRSASCLSYQTRLPWTIRSIFTGGGTNNDNNESPDDFEQRIFGNFWDKGSNGGSFFQKLDRIEKAHGKSGTGSKTDGNSNMQFSDGIAESFDTLSDGMDTKLRKAATSFAYDEMKNDDYSFRPDVTFQRGTTYNVKDLDLTKPGVQKAFKRPEFDVTSEEVMRKADFRNVRFLAQFITEAGIIIKRSQTRISAKAQRKVAREIKTARAFGLMPFTTMGTKPFVFGRSMNDLEENTEPVSAGFGGGMLIGGSESVRQEMASGEHLQWGPPKSDLASTSLLSQRL